MQDNQGELTFSPHNTTTANWNSLSISICKLVKIEAVSNQLERKTPWSSRTVTLDHRGLSTESGWMCRTCPGHAESDALYRRCSGCLSDAAGWSFHCTGAWPWIKPFTLSVWQTVFKDLSIWIFKLMALFPSKLYARKKKNYVWKITFICPKSR